MKRLNASSIQGSDNGKLLLDVVREKEGTGSAGASAYPWGRLKREIARQRPAIVAKFLSFVSYHRTPYSKG